MNPHLDYNHDWILLRDGGRCRYCQREVNAGRNRLQMHFDHVYPHSLGGGLSNRNIVVSCRSCNLRKNAKVIDYERVWARNDRMLADFEAACEEAERAERELEGVS